MKLDHKEVWKQEKLKMHSFSDQEISMQVNSIPESKDVIICGGLQLLPHCSFWNGIIIVFLFLSLFPLEMLIH